MYLSQRVIKCSKSDKVIIFNLNMSIIYPVNETIRTHWTIKHASMRIILHIIRIWFCEINNKDMSEKKISVTKPMCRNILNSSAFQHIKANNSA
jgi:hypothetical protein